MASEKRKKLDIRGRFTAKTGEEVTYRIFEPEKKREEKTVKEFAEDLTEELFESSIRVSKDVIRQQIEVLEGDLRIEKASRVIAESKIGCILSLCKKAAEDGKLDKEVYDNILRIKNEI